MLFLSSRFNGSTMRRTIGRRAIGLSLFALGLVFLDGVSGKRTLAADSSGGATEKNITVDGLERKYFVFVPGAGRKPLPVVLVFHGGGANPRQMEKYTRFNEVAEKEGFAVIYPEAVAGNWNDGRGVEFVRSQKENIDDVKFVRALLDDVAAQHRIDRSRVFATGISNGAFISHRLAAEASDAIAAVAPVVGGMAPAVAENFNPEHPVSILVIQGQADPMVPLDGGDVGFYGGRKRGKVLPTKASVAKYVERNGIQGNPSATMLDADPKDGTSVEITRYPDGPYGAKVHYYLVNNGGHAWPGRPLYLSESVIGKASQEFSASEVIWDFFKSCPPRSEALKYTARGED